MFSALLWKEWRQLRMLRWGGCALGLAMPPLLILVAEGAQAGWLPFASLSGYSIATVLRDAAPEFSGMFVWPLLALMFAAQAFAADRAEGTDGFLLARPVRRASVWRARLAASAGTTALVLVVHWVFWWLLVRVSGSPAAGAGSVVVETSGDALWRTLGNAHVAGLLLSAVALLAGTAAGSLVRSPMQAILLGIALTLVPAGIAGLVGASFAAVRLGFVHLGWLFSALIVVGYLVASYVVDCRGEPAGRGRWLRGAIAVGLSVLSVPVLLVAAAPSVMRLDARRGLGNTIVLASPDGGAAVVANDWQGAGWLVDVAAAKTLRFLPPRVAAVAWSPDGARVAIVHSAAALGRETSRMRIEVFDATGHRLREAIDCPECGDPYAAPTARWVGETLLVRGEGELVFVSVEDGARQVVEIGQPTHTWTVLGPTDDGRHFVYRAGWEGGRRSFAAGEAGLLEEIDVDRHALEPAVRIEGAGHVWHARSALSPSGRYWIRARTSETMERVVVDLSSGQERPFAGHAAWLDEDRLVTAVRGSGVAEVRIGQGVLARTLRSWPNANVMLKPSPDGRRLLVNVVFKRPDDEADPSRVGVDERWVYDLVDDGWSAVPDVSDRGYLQWAGPETLTLTESGRLAFYDLDGKPWRNAIGSAEH